MMLPVMDYKGRTLAFMADLLPSAGHIPLPYVMGYDMRPLITMTEKEAVLRRAAEENWVLLLEHDPLNEACTVQLTERGVITDAYDALTNRRVYREGVPHDVAVQQIFHQRAAHFDPDMVDAFIEIQDEFLAIARRHADTDGDFQKKIDYMAKAIAESP